MNVLDLFSGIGGFSLGLERAGMRTVAFCEIEPYCRAVLRKHWPDVPMHADIRGLTADDITETIDLVCGGFPCQPWSVAGQQRGEKDDRDLWPEMRRVIAAVGPRWIIGENVPGLDDSEFMGLDRVLSDLEGLGYQATTLEIPACSVDAPHRRSRLWIVANASGGRCGGTSQRQGEQPRRAEAVGGSEDVAHAARFQRGRQEQRAEQERAWPAGEPELMADTTGNGSDGIREARETRHGRGHGEGPRPSIGGRSEPFRWEPEPDVGRVAIGIPSRVDRLRSLGNAVVPQVVEEIGRAIMAADREDI